MNLKDFLKLFFDYKLAKHIEAKRIEVNKIIDMINRFPDDSSENINTKIEAEITKTLGKPTRIEYYNDGDVFFEKRIWETISGDIIRLIVLDDPSIRTSPPPPKSLQEQLNDAVLVEDYGKASVIRDLILNSKKN